MAIEPISVAANTLAGVEVPGKFVPERVRLEADGIFEQVEDGADSAPTNEIPFGGLALAHGVWGVVLPDGAGLMEHFRHAVQMFQRNFASQIEVAVVLQAANDHG